MPSEGDGAQNIVRATAVRFLVSLAFFLLLSGLAANDVSAAEEAFVAVYDGVSADDDLRVAKVHRRLSADILVRRGRPAPTKRWPASYHRGGHDMCGGTLISERVFLTARHCVEKQVHIRLLRGAVSVRAVCSLAQKYLDKALCLLDSAMEGAPYERVNLDAALLREGLPIQFVGAGCTESDMTGADGVFRVGETKIDALPVSNRNEFVAKEGSMICPGDSGGGAFLVHARGRQLVGLNSATKAEIGGETLRDVSIFTSTSTPAARAFVEAWARAHSVSICGVTPNAKNCQPPP